MGLAAEVEHDGGGEEQGSRHGEQAALIVAGKVTREPHPIRPDEPAQDAQHVDGGDAGGGGPVR